MPQPSSRLVLILNPILHPLMPKLAVQLYSLRRETEKNPEEVLLQLPGIGFEAVELAGDYGWSADKWKEVLAKSGLKVMGAHVHLDDIEAKFNELVAFHRSIGNPRLIVPWLEEKWYSLEGFREIARRLHALAPRVHDAGLSLHYHNHDFEFRKLSDGSIGFDILLKNTDPALVGFEVDTYWIEKSGYEALAFLRKHESRVSIVHAKEFQRAEQKDCAAGKGDINFKEIVPLAVKNDWPIVVECEGENAIEIVRESAQYLSKL